jgi:hypothetical protein
MREYHELPIDLVEESADNPRQFFGPKANDAASPTALESCSACKLE